MSQGFDNKSAAAHQSFRTQRKPTEVADIRCIQQSLVQHFQGIKDPRVERTKKHQLTDILVIAILAVIAGALLVGRHGKLWVSQATLVSRVFRITKRNSIR